MTRLQATGTSLALAIAVCGCATRGNVGLLEARLRQQEDRLYHLESQLVDARQELNVARKSETALRAQLIGEGQSPLLAEQSQVLHRASGVRFHSLLTGGLDRDQQPGDEVLAAVLVPHDADGEPLKLPGRIELAAFGIDPLGRTEEPLGRWEYDLEQSRAQWHAGFLGSGYMFRLSWQAVPPSRDVVLHARLTTSDGREFTTRHDLRITPPQQLVENNAEQVRVGPVFREATSDSMIIPAGATMPPVVPTEPGRVAPDRADTPRLGHESASVPAHSEEVAAYLRRSRNFHLVDSSTMGSASPRSPQLPFNSSPVGQWENQPPTVPRAAQPPDPLLIPAEAESAPAAGVFGEDLLPVDTDESGDRKPLEFYARPNPLGPPVAESVADEPMPLGEEPPPQESIELLGARVPEMTAPEIDATATPAAPPLLFVPPMPTQTLKPPAPLEDDWRPEPLPSSSALPLRQEEISFTEPGRAAPDRADTARLGSSRESEPQPVEDDRPWWLDVGPDPEWEMAPSDRTDRKANDEIPPVRTSDRFGDTPEPRYR